MGDGVDVLRVPLVGAVRFAGAVPVPVDAYCSALVMVLVMQDGLVVDWEEHVSIY